MFTHGLRQPLWKGSDPQVEKLWSSLIPQYWSSLIPRYFCSQAPLGFCPSQGRSARFLCTSSSCLLDLGIYLVNFVLKQIYLHNFHYLCQKKRNDNPRKLKQKNISFIEIKVLQNRKSQRIESQKKSAVAQIWRLLSRRIKNSRNCSNCSPYNSHGGNCRETRGGPEPFCLLGQSPFLFGFAHLLSDAFHGWELTHTFPKKDFGKHES